MSQVDPNVPVEPVTPAAAVPPVEPVVPPTEPAPAPVPPVEPAAPAVPPAPAEPVQIAQPPVYEKPAPTGNAFFDSAATVLYDSGFDVAAISQEVAGEGLSAETRSAMVAKLGEAQVTMLESGLAHERTVAQNAHQPTRDLVYQEAGGEEMWKAIEQWTTTADCGLTPEGEAEYNKMLAAGGMQAQLAVKALKEAYMASPGFKAVPNLQTPDGIPPAQGQVEAISRKEYVDAKSKAVRENNGVAVAALEARARYTMEHHPTQWNANLAQRVG